MTNVTPEDLERSRQETLEHIAKVRAYMGAAIANLVERAAHHDASKLREPELSGFAYAAPRLASAVYGSPEYQALLDESRATIDHHYAHNDHHPNHHANGINDMTLLSIIEMLCDWKAAGERTQQGSIEQSLRVNILRYNIDDQLAGILFQTAGELGWL